MLHRKTLPEEEILGAGLKAITLGEGASWEHGDGVAGVKAICCWVDFGCALGGWRIIYGLQVNSHVFFLGHITVRTLSLCCTPLLLVPLYTD